MELGGRGASFLVIRDNGRGMNASGLKDFATYFLTQVGVLACGWVVAVGSDGGDFRVCFFY